LESPFGIGTEEAKRIVAQLLISSIKATTSKTYRRRSINPNSEITTTERDIFVIIHRPFY